jgi:hypothetical protein
VDSEDPSALLNGRYSVIVFSLESCIAVEKGMSTEVAVCLVQEELHPLPKGLEEHSSCMLVKEQLATRAREDLVSTCRQIKLTQFGLCDSCLSPSGMSSLRAKQCFTFYVEHVSAKFCSSWHLCHSIVEHPKFLKHWSEH